jgi:hypothetical protein
MNPRGRCRNYGLVIAILLGALATGSAQGAQDAFDADIQEDVVDAGNANGLGMAFIQQQPGIEQFEQWVFNRMGGAAIARNRLNAALDLHIDEINRVCGMDDTQKRKLQLAGRGDIKRFFDRVEEAKRRYLLAMNDQNHNIWEDIQPLQSALNVGLFGDNSIFAKTVKKVLSNEQVARRAESEQLRNKNRYSVTIGWFVIYLDKVLGMTADQRKRLAELLRETSPPRRFGSGDYYYLMYRAGQISEERLKRVFDDAQWRLFSLQLNQARGMHQWLKNNGMIEDEPAGGDRDRKLAEAAKTAQRAAVERKAIRAAADQKVAKGRKQ